MRAGQLRSRVRLEQPTATDDGQGGSTTAWTTVDTFSADVSGKGGKEFQAAKQVTPTLSHQVRTRYRTDCTADRRLVIGGTVLRIASSFDPDGRSRETLLFCESIAGETP